MNAFFDSGVLVKLYALERDSSRAVALAAQFAPPLPLTELQESEARNAFRLKCARGETNPGELAAGLAALEGDLRAGKLRRTSLDWPAVWQRTEQLSAAHAQATFCRTLDILHVAAALELGAGELVSFDRRQRVLAGRAGLQVLPTP